MKINFEPVKNWFGFTRKERRASVILLFFIFIILLVRYTIPEKNIEIQDLTFRITGIDGSSDSENRSELLTAKPFQFDPNTASMETLVSLGLDERESKTLISYRNKGGKFRKQADIRKIYGIDKGKAEQLMPYVKVTPDTIKRAGVSSNIRNKVLIDLNSSDTAELATLPGIGKVLSLRIIKYRNLLGGFACVNQLKEVYGLPVETYDMIKGRVLADSSVIVRIKINSAGFKELMRLPYFKSFEITSILKYRELKGRFESINDLTSNKLIAPEKAARVRPYLSFE